MTRFKNHRSEENRFKKWKERAEKFMRENGLTEDKIKLIYNYDRMIFNSDRRFYEHALQPSENFFEFVCDNSTAEITTIRHKTYIFELFHYCAMMFLTSDDTLD